MSTHVNTVLAQQKKVDWVVGWFKPRPQPANGDGYSFAFASNNSMP